MVNMVGKRPLFILAGNGPYNNRGCEAIVRGTIEILQYHFYKPKFIIITNYHSSTQFEKQKVEELDADIVHKKNFIAQKKFGFLWFLQTSLRFLYPKGKRYITYKEMLPYLKDCFAVLSIGGDNYSLDYGVPRLFTDLDDFVLSKEKPIIIWGASVGPFNKKPKYEKYIIEHLKKVNGIFARESTTVEYLNSKGITKNVYSVADPAFLMKPKEPPVEKFNIQIPKESIGVNLSPLMAKYVTNGDLKKWVEYAANIIRKVSKKNNCPIFLVAHVTSPHTNDYEFLKNVMVLIGKTKEKVTLIPPNLNAAETKWVISKMFVFAGARTHSTIAAISSGVPTVSFAYSIKSKGINRDVLGNDYFCINPEQLKPNIVVEKIDELVKNAGIIKNKINITLPKVKRLAMKAGKYLKEIVDGF